MAGKVSGLGFRVGNARWKGGPCLLMLKLHDIVSVWNGNNLHIPGSGAICVELEAFGQSLKRLEARESLWVMLTG